MAAALCISILRNHPFVDGNKRAAFAALGVTLLLNDLYLDVSESEATRIMFAAAADDISEEDFQRWVAANCLAAPDQG